MPFESKTENSTLWLPDVSVGTTSISEIPPEFAQAGINMFLERCRRVTKLHPEFSQRLSDFDRSALWRSNYLMAVAVNFAKVICIYICINL